MGLNNAQQFYLEHADWLMPNSFIWNMLNISWIYLPIW